jgi:ribosomal protein L16 Arg81 hydroxylase
MHRYHFSYPLHPTLSGDLADQLSGGAGAWAALHPEAVHTSAEQLRADATERVLEAGDFMYLPASFVHQVTAETDSLSVTVCIPVPMYTQAGSGLRLADCFAGPGVMSSCRRLYHMGAEAAATLGAQFNVYVPSAADHMARVMTHLLRMDSQVCASALCCMSTAHCWVRLGLG